MSHLPNNSKPPPSVKTLPIQLLGVSAGTARLLLLFLLLKLPAVVQAADYTYTSDGSAITITSYDGPGGVVDIPIAIEGLPVTRIGSEAFSYRTSLTSVTIPNRVTGIGDQAFYGCSSLSAITVEPLNSVFSSVDGVLFDKSQTTLIQYPGGKAGSYTRACPNAEGSQ
ncbi:MAG: hypothetical protein EXS31_15175 [Pedosphaera sp.]|nr:hypothetical protein [Pedosphaera sp.]